MQKLLTFFQQNISAYLRITWSFCWIFFFRNKISPCCVSCVYLLFCCWCSVAASTAVVVLVFIVLIVVVVDAVILVADVVVIVIVFLVVIVFVAAVVFGGGGGGGGDGVLVVDLILYERKMLSGAIISKVIFNDKNENKRLYSTLYSPLSSYIVM